MTSVAVTTAETHRPLSNFAQIHCLVAINTQHVSLNASGCHLFYMKEFNYTPLFHTHFPVRHHFVIQQQNIKEYWWECSNSTAVPPTPASDSMRSHNKMEIITFGSELIVCYSLQRLFVLLFSKNL